MKNYLLFTLLGFTLTACGQIGPLYLPPPETPAPPVQVEKPKQATVKPPASMPVSPQKTK
jgi:predicted small lipoprotein YifL